MDLTQLADGDLTALQRALLEARFPEKENDSDIWLSPYVIALHCAVVREERHRMEIRNDSRAINAHDRWLAWENRLSAQAILRRRLAEDRPTRLLILENPQRLREFVKPFVLGEDLLNQLLLEIRDVEASHD